MISTKSFIFDDYLSMNMSFNLLLGEKNNFFVRLVFVLFNGIDSA
jgi:hypothetical protein